jgi:predicted polyphosphate/ATP-dependent NAD kinase
MSVLRMGLIVNPLAGMGGVLGLKGSDLTDIRRRANTIGSNDFTHSMKRVQRALSVLEPVAGNLEIVTCKGSMGEQVLLDSSFSYQLLDGLSGTLSTAVDTRVAAKKLCDAPVDVLVFAGGDGTARDVFDAVGTRIPVLGIPAGVKMHSGVFAVSPEGAAEFITELIHGELVGVSLREVRDIDEQAFRLGTVRSRFYGEMYVPGEGRYLQHTKIGGRENVELVAHEIAQWLVEEMQPNETYLIGPGSTTAAIMDAMGLPNTLLGVDVIRDRQLLLRDANEAQLLALLAEETVQARIIVTAIGGQGHVFGRGNQQLSPAVLRRVGTDNIIIVAAKSKLAGLKQRPLLVDTNDHQLDKALCGYHSVTTGYNDHVLYRVETGSEHPSAGMEP